MVNTFTDNLIPETNLHICWRLLICFNLETGFNSWTRIGPLSGLLCKKNKYRPERECSTAFSMKSTIVLLLNFVRLPKLKFPKKQNQMFMRHCQNPTIHSQVKPIQTYCRLTKDAMSLPWSCSIRTWLTFPFNLKVNEKI